MIVLLQIRVKPVVSCAESVKLDPCFARHVEPWWRVYETEICGFKESGNGGREQWWFLTFFMNDLKCLRANSERRCLLKHEFEKLS